YLGLPFRMMAISLRRSRHDNVYRDTESGHFVGQRSRQSYQPQLGADIVRSSRFTPVRVQTPILTMRPHFLRIIPGNTAWLRKKGPLKLVAMTRSHSS